MSTAELDSVCARTFDRYGARAAPALVYGFPGTACISVDNEAVHGIPGPRRLEAGDLVKLDVTAELDGYFADAAITVPVPQCRPRGCASLSVLRSLCARPLALLWRDAP